MTDPVLELNSSPDSFINKSVHTSDGVLIGNIHAIVVGLKFLFIMVRN